MSHAIYQTPALILKTKNMRESNKLVFLYTKRFGLIYASMQSVRKLESKMRYHVHQYSIVYLDILSGKNIWRITGIHEKKSSFDLVRTPWYTLVSVISEILIRLCTGEEKNEILWDNIILFFDNFNSENEKFIREYEIIIMVRVLHTLGYWDSDDLILKKENPYLEVIFKHIIENRKEYIKKINESLVDSQL